MAGAPFQKQFYINNHDFDLNFVHLFELFNSAITADGDGGQSLNMMEIEEIKKEVGGCNGQKSEC